MSKILLVVQLNNFFRTHGLSFNYDVQSIKEDYKSLKMIAVERNFPSYITQFLDEIVA